MSTSAFPRSPTPPRLGGSRGARLQTFAELEERRDELQAAVARIRRDLDSAGERQELARGRMEAIMLDPASPPLGARHERGHRRAGLPAVPRAPPARPARLADELVAGHHLLRVPLMHAIGRSTPLAVYRAVVAVAIVVGSLAMWLGIPLFWIWVMSQLIDEYPSIYLLSLAACPLTMILWGWMLSRLNRVYGELTPHDRRRSGRAALRLARKPERRTAPPPAPAHAARRQHGHLRDHRRERDGGLVLRLRAPLGTLPRIDRGPILWLWDWSARWTWQSSVHSVPRWTSAASAAPRACCA